MLPLLSVLGASLSPNTVYSDWWTSISITYYSSPILIAILSSVGFMLISYSAYNVWDKIVNTLAGVCALCVVSFPTEASWLSLTEKVGLFWLPISITRWVHYTSAFLLFILLAINSIWLFSKGQNHEKNVVYKICGIVILVVLVLFSINMVLWHVKWLTIVFETIMLLSFGFSWIVKGHMLDKFFGE